MISAFQHPYAEATYSVEIGRAVFDQYDNERFDKKVTARLPGCQEISQSVGLW
jgi:hypothetical protein